MVSEAARGEECWLERVRAGLEAALGFLDDEPRWASLLVVEWPLEGLAVAECAQRVHGALGEVLEAARGEMVLAGELSPSSALIAELLVTGVLSVIRARMLKGEAGGLVALAPSLMSFVVVPYLGRGAAKADRTGGGASSRAVVVPIRPHPRTILVLGVIASRPRLSNREVALAVGVKEEEGHTSRLLKTLEQRGLIENASAGWAKGEPNAWLLTVYGRRVLELITNSSSASHSASASAASEQEAPRPRSPRLAARGAQPPPRAPELALPVGPTAPLPLPFHHRTALVLRAVASAPRASNREIAQAAGMADEGQISHILRRLSQRGLIEKVTPQSGSRRENAWLLTDCGQSVVELLGIAAAPGAPARSGAKVRQAAR